MMLLPGRALSLSILTPGLSAQGTDGGIHTSCITSTPRALMPLLASTVE